MTKNKLVVITLLCASFLLGSTGISLGQCSTGNCPTTVYPDSYYNRGVVRGLTKPIVKSSRNPAIPQILIYDSNGSISIQTGCLVWKHGVADLALVVTAAHGFTSDTTRVAVWTTPTNGFEASVMKIDHIWDVAVLGIRRPSNDVFVVSRRRPVLGTVMFLGGFAQGRIMRWGRGILSGWAGPQGNYKQDLLVLQGVTSESGQSGGPILDEQGRLLGILVAGDNEGVICVPYSRIAPLIDEVISECQKRGEKENKPDIPPIPVPKEDPIGDENNANETALAELKVLIQKNAEAIALLAATEPRQGPQGERGPQGPRGLQGPPGVPGASFDPSQLTDAQIQMIALRLPPVRLQTITPKGDVIEEASAPLGSPLKLRLVPIKSGAN